MNTETSVADEGLPGDGFILRRLRRVTKSTRYLPAIDGWRFLAIAWVVLFHLLIQIDPQRASASVSGFYSYPLWFVWQGHWGVQIFFVISGYIIGVPFARAAHSNTRVALGKYFWRRVTRLEPPFAIATLAIYSAYVLRNGVPFSERLGELLATLTYTHVPIFQHWSRVNAVTWSLEVEIQFYLIAPVMAALFLRPRNAKTRYLIFFAAILLAALLRTVVEEQSSWLNMTLLAHLAYFLAGFLLADWHANKPLVFAENSCRFDGLAVACGVAFLACLSSGSRLLIDQASPWLFIGAIHGVMRGVHTLRLLSIPALTAVGGMCYTMYLYHQPLMRNLGRLSRSVGEDYGTVPHFFIQCAILLPALLVTTCILFVLFEKPFMYPHWPDRLLHKLGLRQSKTRTTKDTPARHRDT